MTNSITFTIPYALPSLNAMLRTHWAKRSKAKHLLAQDVMAALNGPAHFPRPAWNKVRITITRRGKRLLDADNLAGSAKPLVDVLCLKSKTHPAGLGIIVDDRPELLTLETRQAIAQRVSSTCVRIECLDEAI